MSQKRSLLLATSAVAVLLLALTGTAPRARASPEAGEAIIVRQQSEDTFTLLSPGSCALSDDREGPSMVPGGGPAEGCCARHATICETICPCGISGFSCQTTSTGGCSSACWCIRCDP